MKSGQNDIKLLPPMFSAWEPKRDSSRQIAVLMSGGVDSSVTAYLLSQASWDVLGITMQVPVADCASGRSCCGADAAFVCNELGIAHYFVDVKELFARLIIEPFRESYARGETPNPCADCNTFLKFSVVWDFLKAEFGIEYLATGHYARIVEDNCKSRLGMASDKSKDQSYFLYGISAERLNRLVLPLGELSKEQVRSKAAKIGLSVAEKKESMELCFAGEGDYRNILGGGKKEGELTDMSGKKIGTHQGISHYTLGQRRGLGFAGGEPLYVGGIDPVTNTVALGRHDEVCKSKVKAGGVNVLISEELRDGAELFGKIRSYGKLSSCKVESVGDGFVRVAFDEVQFAPCPGQKLVLYNADGFVVAGGGIVLSF